MSYVGHSQGTTQLFLAGSVHHDYFTEKINCFIALAPVASTEHIKIKALRYMAEHIHSTELVLVKALKLYDWFPHMSLGSEALDAFCLLEKNLCETLASEVFDPEINNVPRFEYAVSLFPSGQSYRAMVWYAQSIRGDYKFSLYNFGKK